VIKRGIRNERSVRNGLKTATVRCLD